MINALNHQLCRNMHTESTWNKLVKNWLQDYKNNIKNN